MKNIAIYGAGGFGKEVACLIKRINEKNPTWNLVCFFDDNLSLKGKMISHFAPCYGGINDLNKYSEELNLVVAIGNPDTMRKVVCKINNQNIQFPNIIHPNIVFSDMETCKMGKGNIIQGNCTFSCDVTVGDFNIFNGSVVLGHDVKIGSFNSIMPAVRVSGEVSIGSENLFGVGAIVLQQIKIGDRVHLGAGGVLMTKPKDGGTYIGNPARLLKY